MSKFHKLIVPSVVLVVFSLLALYDEELLRAIGTKAIAQMKVIIYYTSLVGIWLSGAWTFNRLIRLLLWEGIVERTIHAKVPNLLKNFSALVIYLVAVTGIVGFVFDQNVTGFWTTSSVVGIVLGFALRSMIQDLFTGIAINIDRGIKIGDWIRIAERSDEFVGRVEQIGWRTTQILTEENNVVFVPNGLIGTMVVTNFSSPTQISRQEVRFEIDYEVPADRVKRVIMSGVKSVIQENGIVSDPPPVVLIGSTKESGVEYKVRYFLNAWSPLSPSKAKNLVNSAVLDQLNYAGISLAYPKEDIFYAQMPTRQFDSKTVESRAHLLMKLELFSLLNWEELLKVSEKSRQVNLAQGDSLIRQGEEAYSMYVVVEGLFHILIDFKGDGNQTLVGKVKAGEFLGEMSALTGASRSATAIAETDCVVYEVTRDQFAELIGQRPELVDLISKVVAERRVRITMASKKLDLAAMTMETTSLASQIRQKMLAFFKKVMN